jgi:glycosyltransferase involved in cell wall biosynthesis
MTDKTPKVSIGLAVFNGEKYLREAINSILAQTFTDFELIISDNASTDSTEEICRDYAAKDSRIRYYRNVNNIGGANNENRTFLLSRGQYFRLAAHDDVLAPELIEKCVEVLDADTKVVLCYSTIITIDENSRHIAILDRDMASSIKPHKRFLELVNCNHNCETSYGLIRADILRKTDLQLNYPDSDRTLLCELSLYGRFYRVSDPLFYKRCHPDMSTKLYPDMIARMAWFNPSDDEKIHNYLQFGLVQLSHYLRIVSRVPLAFNERVNCYLHIGRHIIFQSIVIGGIKRIRRKLFITRESFKRGKDFFTKVTNKVTKNVWKANSK